jgi:hypothetical protein
MFEARCPGAHRPRKMCHKLYCRQKDSAAAVGRNDERSRDRHDLSIADEATSIGPSPYSLSPIPCLSSP